MFASRWLYVTVGTYPLAQALYRLGTMYLNEGRHLDAKDKFITSAEFQATATAWLGVGRACMALGEIEDAEDALAVCRSCNQGLHVVPYVRVDGG